MDGKQPFVLQRSTDDVATALQVLPKGTEFTHETLGNRFVLQDAIPFGHKFAVRDLSQGAKVHKYGQVIGRATGDIRMGEHVHVHNLESLRGRGDLQRGETVGEDSSLLQG